MSFSKVFQLSKEACGYVKKVLEKMDKCPRYPKQTKKSIRKNG
jgi:hypothetical protein